MAEAKGKVEFEVAPLSSDKINDYLTELFEVEAASWKGRTGTAMKSYKSLGQFFRYYSALESERGNLRLFFLRVNGKAIAAQLTVVHANRLWVFKIGHDESWSSCSPGILLMHNVIRYCFDEGLESCEMLGSDEPWLHIWGNEVHSVLTYRIYPRTFDAVIDLTGNFANMFIYKLGKKLAKKR